MKEIYVWRADLKEPDDKGSTHFVKILRRDPKDKTKPKKWVRYILAKEKKE